MMIGIGCWFVVFLGCTAIEHEWPKVDRYLWHETVINAIRVKLVNPDGWGRGLLGSTKLEKTRNPRECARYKAHLIRCWGESCLRPSSGRRQKLCFTPRRHQGMKSENIRSEKVTTARHASTGGCYTSAGPKRSWWWKWAENWSQDSENILFPSVCFSAKYVYLYCSGSLNVWSGYDHVYIYFYPVMKPLRGFILLILPSNWNLARLFNEILLWLNLLHVLSFLTNI